MALVSIKHITEMNTRNTSWGGKGGRSVGLRTIPPSCADCHEIWEPQSPGTLRACPGLYRNCFTFTLIPDLMYPTPYPALQIGMIRNVQVKY